MRKIYEITPRSSERVMQRLMTEKLVASECQHQTEEAAWAEWVARRSLVHLPVGPSAASQHVVVHYAATGRFNHRDIEFFTPLWDEAKP